MPLAGFVRTCFSVTLDQLSTVLPATTVYVTPAQRQAQIAQRQSDYNARFAPYPQT
jgi:hypothetical protein